VQKHLQRQLIPGAVASMNDNVPVGTRMQRVAAQMLAWRRRAATFVLIGLSASLAVYAVFGHDGLVAYQQKQHQAQELHQQILSLQKENERMALHDKRLQNDRDTIEYEAREQMHYTRPGEVIYTLPEAPGRAKTSTK